MREFFGEEINWSTLANLANCVPIKLTVFDINIAIYDTGQKYM